MGSADVVPGVSGGTVALIVGIYEELVTSVRAAASAPLSLLRGDARGARRRLGEVAWGLVLPLAAGIVVALVVGAAVIPSLLQAYPVAMLAIFFGLIAGSLAVPWRRVERRGRLELGLSAAAFVVAYGLVGLPPRAVADPSLAQVFASAAVAICAMILPGVSGAFLLLVLGVYTPTLDALHDRDLLYVATFVAGCAVGLGLFSRLLEHLLTRHHSLTMAVLVGLMAGSLRALWPWQDLDRGLLAPPSAAALAGAVLLALVAAGAVTLLTRAGARTGREDLPLHD
ncbi:MAG: DUF368 domain-containing protein [Euzebyales bacterium]|nr:DUF368 domain-containing protein [Euzebyales bacterium]